ncbi:MAG: hypothetical protein F6K47_20520 [Symploca sp. SIO2E6]|nr:hypothetical protein [Symploca sp. SIO2E6]
MGNGEWGMGNLGRTNFNPLMVKILHRDCLPFIYHLTPNTQHLPPTTYHL